MIIGQQDTGKQIRAYQVDQLYIRLPVVARLTFIIITVLIIIQWPVINHSVLLLWWCVMVLITAARLVLVSLYRRAKPSSPDIESWAARFLAGTIFSALGWGASGVLLFPYDNLAHQLVLILIIAGMASSGVATLSAVRENVVAFLCVILIPPAVHLLFIGSKIYLIMGGLILFYLAGLILTSRHITDTLLDLLSLRIKSMRQTEKLLESEKRLKESESRVGGILSSMVDLLFAFDKDGRFIFYHPGPETTLMVGPEQFIGKKHADVMPPHINELFVEAFKKAAAGQVAEYEYRLEITAEVRWFSVKLSPMFLDDEFTGAVAVVRDITQSKRAEEKIKASLAEKEVLLKEIHHRVKNNLQIISSLLNLQSGYIKGKKALKLFKNSRERVMAMALIHEKLYESEDLSKIDFREYLRSLIKFLFDSYDLKPGQVQLNMQIDDIALDIESAIPLGLIINELVSNSLKHAFPHHKKGELRVHLGESDDGGYDYALIIRDNGVGFPGEVDFQGGTGLGIMLVNSLLKKLKGVIDLDRKSGTTFTIKFKKVR